MSARLFSFIGGDGGDWRVIGMRTITGAPLAEVSALAVVGGAASAGASGWVLRGLTSNERYVSRAEKDALVARQPALARPQATCGALIPIRKTDSWWALAQDERRAILEDHSRHIATGMRYLPAIARRLHHCRDLASSEPFDFLTWFEYAPADGARFDDLVAELRASEEWRYVEREVDIRVVRDGL